MVPIRAEDFTPFSMSLFNNSSVLSSETEISNPPEVCASHNNNFDYSLKSSFHSIM